MRHLGSVGGLALVFLVAPLLYSISRFLRSGREAVSPWNWRMTFASGLAFTLAFNVTFFIQELFLVVPKAFVPGITPVLFHNDHRWRGANGIVELLQGTGALATLISSAAFTIWLARRPPTTASMRLTVFWLAVLGYLAALPQVVLGAAFEQNDVGRAMVALGLPFAVKFGAAVFACAGMALACRGLVSGLSQATAPRERALDVVRYGALPALAAVPLIALYRTPGATIEIFFPPTVSAIIAAVWLTAAAWTAPVRPYLPARPPGLLTLTIALLALALFFHGVLSHGVEF